ncbi:MAG: hypothetical protein J1F38_05530 [Muribaculaceae bacterium]|nr:hypothetical protein [Muribaculaceae bacterium]
MNFLSHILRYLNPIRQLSSSLRFIAPLLTVLGLATSCTDDIPSDRIDVDEDFSGITLMIPDALAAAEYGATRSDEFVNTRAYDKSRETNFNTLYIVAIEETNEGEMLHTYFKTQYDSYDASTGYRLYKIALNPGKYKFYVVANLNRYLFTDDGLDTTFPSQGTSERNIRNLIINFVPQTPLEPGFLPMACLHENIKVDSPDESAKVGNPDNLIDIQKGNPKKIYADLEYLCSKVRYTILFDRSKSSFGANDIIDVQIDGSSLAPFATNLRHRTPLDPTMQLNDVLNVNDDISAMADAYPSYFILDNTGNLASWNIPLARHIYGTNFDFYEDVSSDSEITRALDQIYQNPWSASKGSWTGETFLNKRAWQGIAYFPENFVSDEKDRSTLLTKLALPYRFNGEEGAESPRQILLDFDNQNSQYGLKRAKSYDVYVVIKNPDPADMVVKVVINDWTLQQLTYQLHGPYELIVDKTYVESLSMIQDAYIWFKSDIPPEEIGFSSPWVSINNNVDDESSRRPIFVGEVVKNSDGSYLTNEEGYHQLRVGFNLEVPYRILHSLGSYGEGKEYDKSDISFFHIIAGNLQKRIDILNLDLDPYLEVTPQTIIVDTRELYTSGYDNFSYPISFETNVDITDGVTLQILDPSTLLSTGLGDGDFKVSKPSFVSGSASPYNVSVKEGTLNLNIRNIITGNPFWNKNNDYTLTFILTVPADINGGDPIVIEKTVTIKVRPFSGTYVIHFRDNTKHWHDTHIYVYQDLTLPSDLTSKEPGTDGYDPDELHPYAGKIVGFIEDNPSSGKQWNAAVQYVFSNNCSFRGWKGYGGPDINNPWEESSWTHTPPTEDGSTYGFVMFGQPNGNFWNYSYAYNITYGIAENQDRKKRYNYEVNFNGDHQNSLDHWGCRRCQLMAPDYNDGNDDHFYTGISMEKEEDGWWKYTLTGVAQPGRTMIIFANHHAPWEKSEGDYTAEDNRWPGDYESGLPLFDFEDNEGWFLFDGNTTNSDQKFTDDKPSNIIPLSFNGTYSNNLTLEILLPSGITVNSIEIGHQYKYTGDEFGYYDESKFDNQYYSDQKYNNGITYSDGKATFTFSNPNAIGFDNIVAKVNFSNGSDKTYYLSPKNFIKSGNGYITAKPLYTEFNSQIELFVKWNDHVTKDYKPGNNGSSYVMVDYGGNSNERVSYSPTENEYGNYKYVTFSTQTPTSNKDQLIFRLPADNNYSKNLKVEDLTKYYIPRHGYYLINVHKLP